MQGEPDGTNRSIESNRKVIGCDINNVARSWLLRCRSLFLEHRGNHEVNSPRTNRHALATRLQYLIQKRATTYPRRLQQHVYSRDSRHQLHTGVNLWVFEARCANEKSKLIINRWRFLWFPGRQRAKARWRLDRADTTVHQHNKAKSVDSQSGETAGFCRWWWFESRGKFERVHSCHSIVQFWSRLRAGKTARTRDHGTKRDKQGSGPDAQHA